MSERRKRPRRSKRRKWKPYSKLTWDERKALEERDSRRANRIRAQMSSCGLTLAPYNTTQFLMEDHNLQEADYEHIPNGHDYSSSPEDEEDFLQRQFIEAYENIHVERLDSMTKTELAQELMCVEDKVEGLEKCLQEDTGEPRPAGLELEAQLEKIRVYREEIQKLATENEVLRKDNDSLRRTTSDLHCAFAF